MARKKYKYSFRPNFGKQSRFGVSENGVATSKVFLVTTTAGIVKQNTFESIRSSMARSTKRKARIKFFTKKMEQPFSKKSLGVRMGSGKSGIDYHGAFLPKWYKICSIQDVDLETVKEAVSGTKNKLPVKSEVIVKKFLF